MMFVGFDVKGEIRHQVILNYHIDEMGFHSGTQLSSSLWVFDNWWCIVIIVDDGGASRMYCWYRVRWGIVIIVNDGTSSLWRPWGCIGGQDRLSPDSRVPPMDWFLIDVRVMQRCGRGCVLSHIIVL
jgi:hypothetical protein